jgi:hypothetical protein
VRDKKDTLKEWRFLVFGLLVFSSLITVVTAIETSEYSLTE